MDLLPPSTSENIPERTGMRFTVRSANSPSYSLTRRSGVRKRPTADNADDTVCSNTKDGFVYQKDIKQSDAVERNPQEKGTVVGRSLALHDLGRTEERGGNLPCRSMSYDWRSKSKSLPRTTTAGKPKLLGKTEMRGFEERRTEIEKILRGETSSSSPSHFEDNHSVNHRDFADRVDLRFKTESRPASKLDCPSGPQGGQSIKERIQKLFESADNTTVGGTFPRRFSSYDDYSPVRKAATIWAPKEENHPSSETLASFETIKLKERSTETRKQEELSSKYLEEDCNRRDMIEMGTKSLDRARSRNTVACKIRSARIGAGMGQSQTYEGSILAQRRYNQDDKKTDVTEISKERDEGTKQQSKPRSGIADDVFYANPSEGTLPSPEWKKLPEILSPPSSASVRNKISQFEALTQRAASEVQIPKRSLSVQAQPCQRQGGVKKSGSVKYIGERSYKWETKTDGSSEKRMMFASEKSLSLVDLGFKSGMSETDSSNLLDRRKNDLSKDLGQYYNHKKTLHLSLNEGAQKRSKFLFSEDSNLRDTVTLTHTSDMQPRPQWQISSPVSDDDKTPTSTPLNTPPFPSPVQEPEDFFPIADNMSLHVTGQEDKAKETDSTLPPPVILSLTSEPDFSQTSKSDVFLTDKEKTKENESLDLRPDTSFHNNLSDVFYSNVKAELPKGRKELLDLNAWIAGLDPEYKNWNEYMEEWKDEDDSTQKDDDSNDSDSGDSSVTITSNMSQSENRSFSLR